MFDVELAGSVTADQYERAIPGRCALRSYQQHADELMLCWGLMAAIQRGVAVTCGCCALAARAESEGAPTGAKFS